MFAHLIAQVEAKKSETRQMQNAKMQKQSHVSSEVIRYF